MKKIGIIDVGGGLRGSFGAGVFDYLIEKNIVIPYCIGISAGSANVASYIAKQKGRNYKFFSKENLSNKAISFKNYLKNRNLINLDYIYKDLSNEKGRNPLDYDKIKESNQEYYFVASDAETGKAKFFDKNDIHKDDYRVFACSSCIPIICQAYSFNDHYYYDGAITDPIPVKKCFDDGCDKVIIVLSREIDFRKHDNIIRKIFYRTLKRKYPLFTKKLLVRDKTYNDALEHIQKQYKDKVFIVAPDDTSKLKTLTKDINELRKLYKDGYNKGKLVVEYYKGEMNE